MVLGMEHIFDKDRLRELGLISTKKKRLYEDLNVAFQYLKGSFRKERNRLPSRICDDGTRENYFNLKEGRFRLDTRKRSSTVRVVRHWYCPEMKWMSHTWSFWMGL